MPTPKTARSTADLRRVALEDEMFVNVIKRIDEHFGAEPKNAIQPQSTQIGAVVSAPPVANMIQRNWQVFSMPYCWCAGGWKPLLGAVSSFMRVSG